MKFAISRFSGPAAESHGGSPETVWLPRSRVRSGRSGDLLIVVLSAGVVLTLGLTAMVARFGSPAEATVAAATSPVLRAAPAATPSQPAVALPSNQAAAPAAAPSAEARTPGRAPEAATGSTPAAAVAQAPAQAPTPAAQPAPAAAPAPIGPASAIAAVQPATRSATLDNALAFASPTYASAPDAPAPEPVAEAAPEPAPQQMARLAEEAEPQETPEPATPAAGRAAAKAGEPVAKKGGAGTTWAVYFDQFPSQSAASAKLSALQAKYGPHLGGRTLTYTRSGGDWRVRVSGLTEANAKSICDKVKSAGSACAIGGR